MLTFLQQPLPFELNVQKTFISCLIAGMCIGGFLVLFQPLGISSWHHPLKVLYLMGFGVISWLVPFFSALALHKLFSRAGRSWLVWKELLFTLAFILLIALAGYWYMLLLEGWTYSLTGLLDFTIGTMIVSILPVAANVYRMYRNYLSEHTKIAGGINSELPEQSPEMHEQTVTFISENGKEHVALDASELLFIRSADNYSEIYFLENGQQKKILLRSSLKRLEEQHSSPWLVRCHRNTIVNLLQIQHIEGNSQGYTLLLHHSPLTVTVSRNYGSEILGRLRDVKPQ